MYGHVERLSEEIKKGAASIEGVEAKLWQVSVLLSLYPICCISSMFFSDI